MGLRLPSHNVDEPAGVEALCKEAVNRFGKLDIMINNAGIASGHLLADADAARSERFWRVHILGVQMGIKEAAARMTAGGTIVNIRSEEHTSELQSLMRISYAVFCLKKHNKSNQPTNTH